MQVIHFKGLNGIRAISAFAVVIAHVSMSLKVFNLKDLPTTDLAGFGVTIFFTLSGFLITYLLLKEKEAFGEISISKFYIRRILRIWPLYFFYIFLVLFIVKPTYLISTLSQYLLFVPNIPYAFGNEIDYLGHYWSLGVEEQFYIFWPIIFMLSKNIQRSMVVFLVSFMILKVYLNISYGGYSYEYTLIYVTRYSCMCIGGLSACLFFKNSTTINKINTKYFEAIFWAIILFVTFNRFHLASIIDHEIISVATVIIIFRQIKGDALISLNGKYLNYLGKISFGIYVYHPLIIYILSLFLRSLELNSSVKLVVAYLLVILLTVLVAHLSNKYFENYFLKLKAKFSLIKSQS